jgi:hypothetical protein
MRTASPLHAFVTREGLFVRGGELRVVMSEQIPGRGHPSRNARRRNARSSGCLSSHSQTTIASQPWSRSIS